MNPQPQKPADVSTIVITDCGSTTTKAILIEKVDGVFRQTGRGEAPTTVEAPFEDVTIGVTHALQALGEASGRQWVDDNGAIRRTDSGSGGVDLYLSTSSAGGGLQMLVMGMVRRISAESAERAALGAGAIVADVVAYDDDLPAHQQIDRLRRLRPDMVLLAGGVDGGAELPVIELAELLAVADPKPRFGKRFKLPVVYAGNRELADKISAAIDEKCELRTVDNVRPTIDVEHLTPTRERIHDLFLEHVMRQAPGFGHLVEWADAPVMPTPSAVGKILQSEATRRGINLLCVDIGGATTDIFSVVEGRFTRTVSANLGLSYSAANVLAESGVEALSRWLPFAASASAIRNQVMNKTIRPTTIPDSAEELFVEQAIAREALRLSLVQHRAFATGLKGGHDPSSAYGAAPADVQRESRIALMDIDLIIGSGGVLSHAPQPAQTAAMVIDAFQPEGVTQLAKDSIFMMPHLGVLLASLPTAARSVFERDCVRPLGTCVAPTGADRPGRVCLEYEIKRQDGRSSRGELQLGQVLIEPLAADEEGHLTLVPARKFDVGAGKGKRWSGVVKGGPAGLILDGRGRPLPPTNPTKWFETMGIFEPKRESR